MQSTAKICAKMRPARKGKGKVCYEPRRPTRPPLISGFGSMKRLGVFLLPPGWGASPSQGSNWERRSTVDSAYLPFVNGRCHFSERSLSFETVDVIF